MIDRQHRHLFIIGGACGVASFMLYVLLLALGLSDTPSQFELSRTFFLATTWPVLGIVFSYALYRLIALERQGTANRLAFLFSVVALAIVTAMIAVQLAVQVGVKLYLSDTGQTESLLKVFRAIDMGLDVAWDVFLGWAMMIIVVPMYRHTLLGAFWAVPSFLLGLLLLALNVATFPFPPATQGLFDIGPVVGLYYLLLSIQMMIIGWKKPITSVADHRQAV